MPGSANDAHSAVSQCHYGGRPQGLPVHRSSYCQQILQRGQGGRGFLLRRVRWPVQRPPTGLSSSPSGPPRGRAGTVHRAPCSAQRQIKQRPAHHVTGSTATGDVMNSPAATSPTRRPDPGTIVVARQDTKAAFTPCSRTFGRHVQAAGPRRRRVITDHSSSGTWSARPASCSTSGISSRTKSSDSRPTDSDGGKSFAARRRRAETPIRVPARENGPRRGTSRIESRSSLPSQRAPPAQWREHRRRRIHSASTRRRSTEKRLLWMCI